MDAAVRTDTGRRRRRNEDAYVCEPPLFAIADGMAAPRPARSPPGSAAVLSPSPAARSAARSACGR